jgi:site-specific recombinase XerD
VGSTAVAIPEIRGQCSQDDWGLILSLVLNGISSHHTRRAYSQALEEFFIWFRAQQGSVFNKATVQNYRAELEAKNLAPSSINVRLAAIRKLALEAADNSLMPTSLAAGIARVKGKKRSGVRLGHWLTREEITQLLALPDPVTLKGIRDRALLSLLIGAGLRRSELASLNCEHFQQREGRWLIADLVGKSGRVRSIPIPHWVKGLEQRWQEAANILDGALFRGVSRHGRVMRARLSPQAVFNIVRAYSDQLEIRFRPHDLRRSFAKLAHTGGAPLEQIQLSLGHASIVTTEIYLGVKQNLYDAPCDRLGIN